MPVLLIDDEDSVCVAVQMMLARQQHETVCVGTAAEALSALESQTFGLILMDWSLPDISGEDALHALRVAAPQAKICIISGLDLTDLEAAEGGCGPDAVLRKPFTVNTLSTMVDRLLSAT